MSRWGVCLLLMVLPLILQGKGKYEEKTDTLPEVSVTAQAVGSSIIAPQTLQGKRLRSLAAHSVADAVRYFSGAQVKDYGGVGGIKTIDLRSMGSQQTGIFFDGLQLGNAQNGQIDLGRYSLDNLESIAMYPGQKSEILQPARDFATGASIYLRSRQPRFEEGRRVGGTLLLRTGSFGLINPMLRMDWKVSDSVSLTASAEYTRASGRYKFRYRKVFSDGTLAWDTTATRQGGALHALRLEASAFGRFRRGNWQAKAYYYDSSRGIPGAIVNNVWKSSQRQWDRNLLFQGSIRQAPTMRYEWMVHAKYAHDKLHYLNPDTTLLYIDNTFSQNELYLSTSHRLTILPGWDASLAVDWQYNNLHSSLSGFVKPHRHTLLTALATSLTKAEVRAQANLLFTLAHDTFLQDPYSLSVKRRSAWLHRFSPALSVNWSPKGVEGLDIHAFSKQAFRLPTFNDLYYTDIGNASLRPERLWQTDLGARWQWLPTGGFMRQFSISADAYYNHVSDKIIAVPKGTGQYRWMMTNIGKVKILGLEAYADASVSPITNLDLHMRGTYTFQSARDFSDPTDNLDEAGTYGGQIAYIPRHSFSVTGDAAWKMLTLGYSFIYVGQRWDGSANIPANFVQPWYTHDLTLSATFPIGAVMTTATIEVNNLLNQQYEVIRNYPMPGRNFKFILRFDL